MRVSEILIIIFLVGSIGIAMRFMYEDELNQQEQYCDMVEQGYWPAYNKDIHCGTRKDHP